MGGAGDGIQLMEIVGEDAQVDGPLTESMQGLHAVVDSPEEHGLVENEQHIDGVVKMEGRVPQRLAWAFQPYGEDSDSGPKGTASDPFGEDLEEPALG